MNSLQAGIRRFCARKTGLAGLVLLALMLALALIGPWLVPQNPYDPAALDILDARLQPGSAAGDPAHALHYWLGSDAQGRDMLSAICFGLRISLLVGLGSSGIALVIGLLLGIAAPLAGRLADTLLMRVVDLQLAFPSILIALVLLAIFGPGVDKIMLALIASQWAYFARATRASVLVELSRDYIAAARLLRLPRWRIVLFHLLPNCLPPLLVVATLQLAAAISLEATLSFLGIGLPPTEPSLGLLIANGFQYLLAGDYWISTFPGIALLLTLLGIQLVADRLGELWNPRADHYPSAAGASA